MTAPSHDSTSGTGSRPPSQRGPFVVLALLVTLLIAALCLLLYFGVRLLAPGEVSFGGGATGTGQHGNEQHGGDQSSSGSDQPAVGKGTVTFQLVTDERPLTDGSCPQAEAWTEHEQQCLRLGGGFPAVVTAKAIERDGDRLVHVRLHPPADQTLAELSKTAKDERIAVVAADNRVVTAPTVIAPITSGELEIVGNFSSADTEHLIDLIAD